MEFFDWLNIPQAFLQFFPQEADTAGIAVELMRRNLLICLLVAGGLFLIGLILGGVGLYTIAKKTGTPHAWLGFLPFANTWYAGKIAGEANFFGQKMKRAGLYAMLAEILYTGLETFMLVLQYLLTRPEYYTLEPNEYYTDQYYWTLDRAKIAASGNEWQLFASQYCGIISYLVWFMVLVFFCVVFFAFFRKYYARSPFLMVFLSVILPCRGFTIFAVRNNAPVDYNEYLRRRAEEYARRQNPYGPYGGPGGYGAPRPPAGEDPFGDFKTDGPSGGTSGGSPGSAPGGEQGAPQDDDPFSDF